MKLNKFEKEILRYYGEKNYKKITSTKIGIAGCGGLGSNCAFNLVRAGFKKFVLVDFDKVDYSNLNRQFYFYNQVGKTKVEALEQNLKKISSSLQIKILKIKLNANNITKIFANCDIMVEAFDKPMLKQLIARKIIPTGKLLVSASGLCGIGKSDNIKTRKLKPNFVLVGDLTSCSSKVLPISPRVNIAAAKQADVIVEYVLGR
jgi:sulfur carrier protein ThiS adenylyltransferase